MGTAQAADPEELEKKLQELVELQKELTDRIGTLEAEIEELKAKQTEMEESQEEIHQEAADASERPEWAERLEIKGDFRYRYDYAELEGSRSRDRHRIRARVGLTAKLSETVDFGFQVASGSSDDPISSNQTLGNAFSDKHVWIDLAYLDWHPDQAPGLHLIGGKMKNPFFTPGKSELMWDSDLRPEGIALTYRRAAGSLEGFAVLGGFWADERADESDPAFYAIQGGLKHMFPEERGHVLAGAGGFFYDNIEDAPLLYDPDDSFGNSYYRRNPYQADSAMRYSEDFLQFEAFAELQLMLRDLPLTVFGDYVLNTEADDDNTGWLLGFMLGKCKEPRSWEFRYNYRELEKDAVIGVWTDSDFMDGGTDGKGHEFEFGYQATKRLNLKASYFLNDKYLDSPTDFERFMLDASVKF
jgi:hypothetical protein